MENEKKKRSRRNSMRIKTEMEPGMKLRLETLIDRLYPLQEAKRNANILDDKYIKQNLS